MEERFYTDTCGHEGEVAHAETDGAILPASALRPLDVFGALESVLARVMRSHRRPETLGLGAGADAGGAGGPGYATPQVLVAAPRIGAPFTPTVRQCCGPGPRTMGDLGPDP